MTPHRALVRHCGTLEGTVAVPGDKSISHRALILASLSRGESRVGGVARGSDVRNTARALRRLGVRISPWATEPLAVGGVGLGGWREPDGVLDFGNSGTGIRLMAGLLAAHPFFSVLNGDRYLRRRPMRRIVEPLRLMGARIAGRSSGTLAPLAIEGNRLTGIEHLSPVPSAQVKSALLLAGLLADGETSVIEPELSRDHTERLLRYLGVDVRDRGPGAALVGVRGWDARDLSVPGDPSSAAFLLAAAAIAPQGRVTVRNVNVNPTRTGFLEILRAMGASVSITGRHESCGEPVADITAESSSLRGIDVPPSLVPQTIDEFPILAATALFAQGTTRITGAAELRVKESDRIRTMAEELSKLGAGVRELPDGLEIDGGRPLSGAACSSHGDHRVAMSLAVAGGAIAGETRIAGTSCVATSFPEFWTLMRSLGAKVTLT